MNYLIYLIDYAHNYQIGKIIQEYGYPTKSLIGKKALMDFWLLIQHQDNDVRLQEECLQRCGFASRELAHLTDRVLINKGKKQTYGTQLRRLATGRLTPHPIKAKSSVDRRREVIGLESLSEYIKRANQRT